MPYRFSSTVNPRFLNTVTAPARRLEVTGGQALTGGQLIRGSQDGLVGIAPLVPDQLVGPATAEAMLGEKPVLPEAFVSSMACTTSWWVTVARKLASAVVIWSSLRVPAHRSGRPTETGSRIGLGRRHPIWLLRRPPPGASRRAARPGPSSRATGCQ